MARARRNTAPHRIHHIVNRANRRKPIFRKRADYKAFVDLLAEAVERFGMRLLAFCVMQNHWHLVLWPDDKVSISAFMHWLTSTHVRRYHLHYGLTGSGHLYQARYRNRICKDDRGVLSVIRYVEGNPRAAGLVRRAQDWEWSSLRVRLNAEERGFLTEPPIPFPPNWSTLVNEQTPGKSSETAPSEGADCSAEPAEP